MARYRLQRDVQLTFRQFHAVRAKAGTPVEMMRDGMGNPCFALSPASVETDSPRDRSSIWAHDTKYFYIWAPADAVERVED